MEDLKFISKAPIDIAQAYLIALNLICSPNHTIGA